MYVSTYVRTIDNLDKDRTGVLNETDVIKHVDQETGLKYRRYNRQHSPHTNSHHRGQQQQQGRSSNRAAASSSFEETKQQGGGGGAAK